LALPGSSEYFSASLAKVSARLHLLQYVFSFRARIGDRFLIFLGAGRRAAES
jgi:hypothetical protein